MAKAIMIQGTMSDAGKSLLAAGLCRVFMQDGYRVAPFKSQNMAPNSFVTADGLEMSRAQVMQAEAAGIAPHVWMNPILLKPVSDMGSQVIVNGETVGTMHAGEYFRYKKTLRPLVERSYKSLSKQYDIIVLEGAGSPAEINLKSDDIVNMGMAKMAGAPVLLAGDIDRGGVFAQLYGTLELLTGEEQQMVKGLVINKFRGDVEILRPGLGQLESLCGKPVVGVVPYLQLDLDDEDSLAPRLRKHSADKTLDVAVVRFPHIANFTDFRVLERHPAIGLRYVERPAEIGRPDLLILPGSKNTMADLRWLMQQGMDGCIGALEAGGTPMMGICGGYAMLGQTLADAARSGGCETAGLGLLPLHTVLCHSQTRRQTKATLCVNDGFFAPLSGMALDGYEIPCGETRGDCAPAYACSEDDNLRYGGAAKGNVLGSDLHGFFDAPSMVDALADLLLQARGLPTSGGKMEDAQAYNNRQYDRLAEGLRTALDMQKIYTLLEAGL